MSVDVKEPSELRLVDQHGLCVLPFAFTDRLNPAERLDASPRWRRRVFRPDDPADAERTVYFLPYIRRFLFGPSVEGKTTDTSGTGCQRFDFDWSSLGDGEIDSLRGTLSGIDNQDKEPFECEAVLRRAELLLFPFEIGFLILDFACPAPGATFVEQMKALGIFRMLAPWYVGQPMPIWDTGKRSFHVPQLIAHLLAEFGSTSVPSVVPLPSQPMSVRDLPVKMIHDDRMLVYAFSCLDKSTCSMEPILAERVFRKRSLFPFSAETSQRGDDARERGLKSWQRVRWEGFAKDGGILVAFDMDEFDHTYLGKYNRTYYFDVFLLAVLQRVTLLMLSERLADIPGLTTGSSTSRRILRRLRHDLLLFKNQCCFSQITLRERGLVLWKNWQRTFENETLLNEVNDQSRELEGYLRAQYRERMEWILRLGGFLATTVPLVLGLGVLFGEAEWVSRLRWGLLTVLLVGTGVVASWILFRKPKME